MRGCNPRIHRLAFSVLDRHAALHGAPETCVNG